MICTSILGSSLSEIIKKSTFALKRSDLVELRLDYFKSLDGKQLESIIKKINKNKIIVTIREKNEGGKFFLKNKITLIKKAIDLGVGYVDIEYSLNKEIIKDLIKNKNKTKIILSYHNFKNTPDLIKIYKNIKKLNPDIVKIVTYANKVSDNLKAFDLLKKSKKTISFCMGNKGILSRILCLSYGSYLTFTALNECTAPGQITLDDALNLYKVKKINKNTKILGVIGNPVMHSRGRIVYNKLLKNKNYVYIPFEVDDVKDFFNLIKKINFAGCSVTMPHKQAVIPYLGKIDTAAKKIGAVNSIVKKGNILIGYNTDYIGARRAIQKYTKNKKILLLGAGGAARAVLYALKECDVTVANRTLSKAKTLAREFNCGYCNGINKIPFDILINSTSVGMNSNTSPVPKKILKHKIVFDLVYYPIMTRLLKDAKSMGAMTISGLEMYIYQAMAQFKLWTGKNVSYGKIKGIL